MERVTEERHSFADGSESYTAVRLSAIPIPDPIDAEAESSGREDDDGMVFMPQRTTQDTVDLIHAAIVVDFNSFDGGERCDGRLRERGPPPVPLFSRGCVGLAVNAAVAGFCGAFFANAFRPLFITGFLSTYHADLVSTTNSLLQWPPVLSLFIGVVSDALPISRYHRKPYLLLGWTTTSIALVLAALITHTADTTAERTAITLIALSMTTSCGIQIVWVISLAITVEHAQRETIDDRGQFQGAFFLVYYSVTALTHAVTTRILVTTSSDGAVEAAIAMNETLIVLAGSALVPMPFVVWFYHENRDQVERDTATKLSSAGLSSDLSSHLQQKPVYRIYFFLCGVVILVNARSSSVDTAVLAWCNISKQKFGNIVVAQAMPNVIAVIVWKMFMVNLNWRVLGVMGLVLYAVCNLVLVVVCGFDVARGEWLYYTWTAVASIPLGWFEVFIVILPTEVAGVGREGLVMGLVTSFMALIAIMSTTLWDSFNQATGLTLSVSEIVADDEATRESFVAIGIGYVVLNLCSVALAPLLPPQKLDAQRWRLFGTTSRPASRSLCGAFVVLLLYNVAANWLQVRS